MVTQRRIIGIYSLVLTLFMAAILRVYAVNITGTAAAAGVQGKYTVDVAQTRGMIYDRYMEGLVNQGYYYLASVLPTIQASAALLPLAEAEGERESLVSRLMANVPFVMRLPDNTIYAEGIDIFRVPVRYSAKSNQIAPHIIGYLSGDASHGVAGIERAFDEFLMETGSHISVKYQTDAAGQLMKGAGSGVERSGADSSANGGVVLTIDAKLQALTLNALRSGYEKGAAVVMDIYSGDILAMASIPDFDQNDIAASFDSPNAPFINRAVSGYNIGSAFKMIVAAAALEYGIPHSFSHYCNGYVEIDGRVFRCNNNAIHGEVGMERALKVSCNTYFITLARQIPPSYLATVAKNLGLGSALELAPGLMTQPGNIPGAAELSNESAYANFSFGQGSSLASPLQMAQVVAAIANSGISITPRIIKGFTLDGSTLAEEIPVYGVNQVISERTATAMKSMLTAVVEEGSGRTAKPFQGGAGGKTSSAQTGQIVDGEEIVHAWFAGFYPADNPRYSITVFIEGGESGERAAAPVFRQIADAIAGLNALRAQNLS